VTEPQPISPAAISPAALSPAALSPAALSPAALAARAASAAAPVEGGDGPTGHPAVDAALAELAAGTEAAPAEQVAAYETAHRALQQTLATIDQS
jgi:hypothetical protein